jgi:hypothetical protein
MYGSDFMKKIVAVILSVVVLVTGFLIYAFGGSVEVKSADKRIKDNEKLIVASYNTAAPWGNVLEGTHSSKRVKLFAQQINDRLPDVLGVQEINSTWVAKMEEFLPQYDYYGVKRGGDENENQSEMNGIFYLKDKFEVVDKNTFWISETPDVESKFEGAGCYRQQLPASRKAVHHKCRHLVYSCYRNLADSVDGACDSFICKELLCCKRY